MLSKFKDNSDFAAGSIITLSHSVRVFDNTEYTKRMQGNPEFAKRGPNMQADLGKVPKGFVWNWPGVVDSNTTWPMDRLPRETVRDEHYKTLPEGEVVEIARVLWQGTDKYYFSSNQLTHYQAIELKEKNSTNGNSLFCWIVYNDDIYFNLVKGDYEVKRHDCIASIAIEKKLHWKTIWDDQENKKEFQDKGRDPFLLYANYPKGKRGDTLKLTTPGKAVSGQPTKMNKLKGSLNDVKTKLVLNLERDGKPVEGLYWELISKNPDIHMQAAKDPIKNGKVVIDFKNNSDIVMAKTAKLILFKNGKKGREDIEEYILRINDLDPLNTVSGVQARLKNLGLYHGEIDNDPNNIQLYEAVSAFECYIAAQKKMKEQNRDWQDISFQNDLKEVFGC